MIRFKDAVRIRYCTSQLCEVIGLAAAWSAVERVEVEITCIDDGATAGSSDSLHGTGLAVDLSTAADNPRELERLAAFLSHALEPQYEVLLEGADIHVEWTPRRGKLRGLAQP